MFVECPPHRYLFPLRLTRPHARTTIISIRTVLQPSCSGIIDNLKGLTEGVYLSGPGAEEATRKGKGRGIGASTKEFSCVTGYLERTGASARNERCKEEKKFRRKVTYNRRLCLFSRWWRSISPKSKIGRIFGRTLINDPPTFFFTDDNA